MDGNNHTYRRQDLGVHLGLASDEQNEEMIKLIQNIKKQYSVKQGHVKKFRPPPSTSMVEILLDVIY